MHDQRPEGNLITGADNHSAINILLCRASRHLWMAEVFEDQGAEGSLATLCEIPECIPSTFAAPSPGPRTRDGRHNERADLCGICVYFSSAADLRAIEQRVKTMPRRSLWSSLVDGA